MKISDSKRVSKTACKIYLDADTDLFTIQNLSKNAILVDRLPLLRSETRALFHKSLIQVSDTLMFFLLPNETQEKKKRFLKERRKQLLDQVSLLQAQGAKCMSAKSQQGNENGPMPKDVSGLKGFGRRLNLKEMILLHQMTRDEAKN